MLWLGYRADAFFKLQVMDSPFQIASDGQPPDRGKSGAKSGWLTVHLDIFACQVLALQSLLDMSGQPFIVLLLVGIYSFTSLVCQMGRCVQACQRVLLAVLTGRLHSVGS